MDDPSIWAGDFTWWMVVAALLALAIHSVRVTLRQLADELDLPSWAKTVGVKIAALVAAVVLGIVLATGIGEPEHAPVGAIAGLALVELGEVVYRKVTSLFTRRS